MPDRTVTYEFRGKFQGLTAGLTAAGNSVNDLGTKLTALDRNGVKMRAGLSAVGDSAGKIGLVAAAGLGAVIAVTANFEKAMSAVRAATGETAANMETLRAAAVQAGADTAYSASEAAGAIEELAKAGVSTADILGGGLSGSLNLAAAGAIDVSTAAEISATALTQFGLAGSDVEHVADLLAAGAGKAQGSVQDLGAALGQSGLVASQVGLSIEETTGGLAAFASAGLTGSDAGTSFKAALAALTPNSKEAATLMETLGINAYDAQGNFVGLADFAGTLRSALSGMTDQQRQSTLETVFGSDAVRAASVLYDQGQDGIQGWIDKTNDAGFAAETAGTRLDNLAGDFEQLKGSLETALIGAGSGAQGPLRELVQGLTGAVNAFNDLPPAAQSTASALLGITAVTGGSLWFGAKVVNGIASTKSALSDLGITAGKSKTALQGIGKGVQLLAIIEGVKLLDDALAGLTDSRLEGDLNRNLEALANDEIVGNLDNMGKYVRSVNSSIADGTDTIFGWLPGKTEFSEAADEIQKVDDALASMVESGNGDLAADIFEKIATQSREQGIGLGETNKVFDQYALALNNTAASASTSTEATDGLTAATDDLNSVMGPTAETSADFLAQQKAAAEALKESRRAASDTATSFFNLGDGLNDAEVSLGDWIGQLETQAQALKNFRRNAEEAADKGIRKGLIDALREAGPEGAMRLDQLAGATEKEVRRANRAWATGQAQIRAYTDEVGGVPTRATTNVTANTEGAKRSLIQLQAAIDGLRDGSVTITTIRREDTARGNAGQASLSAGSVRTNAAGGYIAGPGTSTSDSIPAYLSNGEYVMRASSVARYGVAMFDGLNAGRYANGGTVGQSRADISAKADRKGLTGEKRVDFLKDFADDARKALRGLERSSESASAAVDLNKEAVDRETSARDSLQSQFDGLTSSIGDMFRSDLFAAPDDVWRSARGADPIGVLQGDIADSQEFAGLFAGLQARGVSQDSLNYAAGQGEGALETLQAYTDEQLQQYGALFAQREQSATSTGTAVAQAQFGAQLTASNAELVRQTAALDQANARLASLELAVKAADKTSENAGKAAEQATDRLGSSAAKGARNRRRKN